MSDNKYTLIELPKVNDPRGNLSYIEGGKYLPFEIERAYWVYDVPGGKLRHGRALRHTSEMIVALSGSFDVVLDGGDGVETVVHLCRSYKGLLVKPMCWRRIDNFSTNSVALVLASTCFDEDDYIREYSQFIEAVSQ